MGNGKLEWQNKCNNMANPSSFCHVFAIPAIFAVYRDLQFSCHFKTLVVLVVLVVNKCAILLQV